MNEDSPHRPDAADMERRGFLVWVSGTLGLLASVVVGWPLVGSLVGPIYRKTETHYAKVGDIEELPEGQPVKMSYPDVTEDAFLREHKTRDVWVIKHSPSEVTVFSPICTHLGCRYDWSPDAKEFMCPCHGSVFSITGQVLAGPAPRPLDTLPHRIEKDELYVEWERFKPGVATKVLE